MPRAKRTEQPEQDLNLAPIMNMVVILIPLLLLSVVFVSVSVINVNAPSLSPGPVSDDAVEEPGEKLTVTVSPEGFYLATRAGTLPPVAGCPEGPTICLNERGRDVAADFARARDLIASGQRVEGQEMLEQALMAYDWRQLYNELAELKRANPDEDVIHVAADPSIPYAAVVRLFDVSRTRLERDHYDDVASFWQARPRAGDQGRLFPDPVLAVAQ